MLSGRRVCSQRHLAHAMQLRHARPEACACTLLDGCMPAFAAAARSRDLQRYSPPCSALMGCDAAPCAFLLASGCTDDLHSARALKAASAALGAAGRAYRCERITRAPARHGHAGCSTAVVAAAADPCPLQQQAHPAAHAPSSHRQQEVRCPKHMRVHNDTRVRRFKAAISFKPSMHRERISASSACMQPHATSTRWSSHACAQTATCMVVLMTSQRDATNHPMLQSPKRD